MLLCGRVPVISLQERPMPSFVTFGETMVQYNAAYHGPYDPDGKHLADVAGAESNVAVNLQRVSEGKITTTWISRLGDDEAGKLVRQYLSPKTTVIAPLLKGEKTGISFLNHYHTELLEDQHVKVYEREGSAASKLSYEDVEEHIAHADIVHFTGITPALSRTCHDTVVRAMKKCDSLGIPVCLDVNYRAQLWSPNEAKNVLQSLIPLVSIFKLGHDEAETIWGESLSATQYAKRFHTKPGQISIVTKGSSGAILFDGQNLITQKSLPVDVIDPVGAGDAFVAGFLSGLFDQKISLKSILAMEPEKRKELLAQAIRIGNICGALTCTRRGDTSAMPDPTEVENHLNLIKWR